MKEAIDIILASREREGYLDTTADGLREYLPDVSNPVFIVEASSTLDRAANYMEPYGGTITVAHPRKLWVHISLSEDCFASFGNNRYSEQHVNRHLRIGREGSGRNFG